MDQAAVFARSEIVHSSDLQLIPTRLARHRSPDTPVAPSKAAAPPENQEPFPTWAEPLAPIDHLADALPQGAFDEASEEESAGDVPLPARSPERGAAPASSGGEHPFVVTVPIGTPLAEVERLLILTTLKAADGNKQRAARILGISRRGLYVRLAAYGEHVSVSEVSETVVAS
jgi:DNA-binding NtrC family response regulator